MVELLVSIGILAVALITLATLLGSGLRVNRKSADITAGAAVAERQLERAVRSISKDSPAGSKSSFWAKDYPSSGSPWRTDKETIDGTEFTYAIYSTTVNDALSGSPLGAPAADNQLKNLEVVVEWYTDSGGSSKQGYGVVKRSASRLVHQVP